MSKVCDTYFTILFIILVVISIMCGFLVDRANNRFFELGESVSWMGFWPLFAMFRTGNLTDKQKHDRELLIKECLYLYIIANVLKIYFFLLVPLWVIICIFL